MTMLNFGTPRSESSNRVGEGIFVQKATVLKARCEKNARMIEGSEFVDDLAVRMKLDIGKEWEKDLYIGGNFKRSGQKIVGWGQAFRIEHLLNELGIKGSVDEDLMIPREVVAQIQGREIFYLQYAGYTRNDGKVGYKDFPLIAAQQDGESEEDTIIRLAKRFHEDHEKGFVKNYRPELLGDTGDGTDFGFGSNVSVTPAASSDTDEDAPW
jgi:hypothetical protein